MGFDIMHYNLHKTFYQPHGGGGPGGGPVACGATRAFPTGARGRARRRQSGSITTGRKSIGRVRSFVGNFGVLVRAYTYMRMGGAGLRDSEMAVLNANYVLARLRDAYDAADRPAVHARVRGLGARLKRETGSPRSTSPSD